MKNTSQEDLVEAILALHNKLLEIEYEHKDTSNDGISILETEDGSCVQMVHNGRYTLISFDAFEKLNNNDLERWK